MAHEDSSMATKKTPAARKKAPATLKKSAGKAPAWEATASGIAVPDLLPVELVAQTAYQLYLERLAKGLPGDEQSDWLAAERALHAA
jgi:hypothetical protein